MSVFKRYNGSTWEIAGVGITDHTYLTSIGTNTHAQIDTALAGLSTTYSPIAGPGSSQAFAVGDLTTTSLTVNTNTLVTNSSGNVLIGTSTDSGLSKLQVTNGITLGNSDNTNGTVLDWYEESTFTPTIIGLTTAGTCTYSTRIGKFTRIGNMVHFKINLTWSTHNGTGQMAIQGLPYTPSSDSAPTPVTILSANLTYSGTLGGLISAGTAQIVLVGNTINTVQATVNIDATASLYIAGSYMI